MAKHFNFCQKINAENLYEKAVTLQIANKLKNRELKPLPKVTEEEKEAF